MKGLSPTEVVVLYRRRFPRGKSTPAFVSRFLADAVLKANTAFAPITASPAYTTVHMSVVHGPEQTYDKKGAKIEKKPTYHWARIWLTVLLGEDQPVPSTLTRNSSGRIRPRSI